MKKNTWGNRQALNIPVSEQSGKKIDGTDNKIKCIAEWSEIKLLYRFCEENLYKLISKKNKSAGKRLRKCLRHIQSKIDTIKKLSFIINEENQSQKELKNMTRRQLRAELEEKGLSQSDNYQIGKNGEFEKIKVSPAGNVQVFTETSSDNDLDVEDHIEEEIFDIFDEIEISLKDVEEDLILTEDNKEKSTAPKKRKTKKGRPKKRGRKKVSTRSSKRSNTSEQE